MEYKTKETIQEAQKKLASLLEGKDKEVVDALAEVSSVLDSAIQESEKQNKSYEDMKSDYIEIVKNVKFKQAPREDDITPQERTLEDYLKDIKKGN